MSRQTRSVTIAQQRLSLFVYVIGLGAKPFLVTLERSDTVGHLQNAILKAKPNGLKGIDADRLILYKVQIPNSKGLKQLAPHAQKKELEELSCELSEIFPTDPQKGMISVLVEIPNNGSSIAYEEYRDSFIRVDRWSFDQEILNRNMIYVFETFEVYQCPEILQEYLQTLRQKRAIYPNYKEELIRDLGDNHFKELYDPQRFDEGDSCKSETHHMLSVANKDANNLVHLGWKQADADAAFFVPFALYCKTYLPNLSPSFGFGQHPWPFKLVMYRYGQDEDGPRIDTQCQPKSDFFAHIGGALRIIAEIKSQGNDDDRKRMLVQGASLVRLANKMLRKQGRQPNFILMAIYFDSDTTFDRYLIYQMAEGDENKKQSVYCFREMFSNTQWDRARLMQQLYNLASKIEADAQLKDEFDKLSERVTTAGLPHYTFFRSQNQNAKQTGGNATPARPAKRGKKGKGHEGGFAARGYELIDSIGLSFPTPHVFLVRRLKDGMKFVAKVNNDPEEKQILEFLHTREPLSEYIIPLIGSISSNKGPSILLPVRHPVLPLLAHPEKHRSRFLQFAEDLIKGVAFLHSHYVAHRDIKPDNLVYTDTYRLQIIDFDVARRVLDADQIVDEDVGTDGYRAPETRDSYGQPRCHSPIMADRWSCGLVVSLFLDCSGQEGRHYKDLEHFAGRLMNEYASYRPSLCEWFELRNDKRDRVEVVVVAPQKRQRVEKKGPQTAGSLMVQPPPGIAQ